MSLCWVGEVAERSGESACVEVVLYIFRGSSALVIVDYLRRGDERRGASSIAPDERRDSEDYGPVLFRYVIGSSTL